MNDTSFCWEVRMLLCRIWSRSEPNCNTINFQRSPPVNTTAGNQTVGKRWTQRWKGVGGAHKPPHFTTNSSTPPSFPSLDPLSLSPCFTSPLTQIPQWNAFKLLIPKATLQPPLCYGHQMAVEHSADSSPLADFIWVHLTRNHSVYFFLQCHVQIAKLEFHSQACSSIAITQSLCWADFTAGSSP